MTGGWNGICSWYDFAVAIQEEGLALGLLQRTVPISAQRSVDYPTPAARPGFSVLDKTRTLESLNIDTQHWRKALRSMLADLAQNPEEN